MNLVGIYGRKFAGKDTAASLLTDTYGYARVSFGDPIKQALAAMYGAPLSVFYDTELKETPLDCLLGRTPRFLMQTLGTEWGRDVVSPTLWVDLLVKRIARLLGTVPGVVVPDIRFDSEAEAIIGTGGVLVEVTRPGAGDTDTHKSEAGIDRSWVHETIVNDGTIEQLHSRLRSALENQAIRLHRPDASPAI